MVVSRYYPIIKVRYQLLTEIDQQWLRKQYFLPSSLPQVLSQDQQTDGFQGT